MLSIAQLEYLNAVGINVRVNGNSVVGGDAQYDAELASPDLATFRQFSKDEVSGLIDEKISEKYERAKNPRYQAKHQEALIYKSAGYTGSSTDFNYLNQEALERGLTMTQVADLIIAAVNVQNDKIAKMEKRRINMNNALDAALTIADINTVRQAAIDAIEAM